MQSIFMPEYNQLDIIQWSTPSFEVMHYSHEGLYLVLEGELTLQDCNRTYHLQGLDVLFFRRGHHVIHTNGKHCCLIRIELMATFLQGFIQKFAALLSEVTRREEVCSDIITFDSTALLRESVMSLMNLYSHHYLPVLIQLRIEELLLLLLFSTQGPALMAVFRRLSNRQAERLQAFMEKNYLKEWTLSEFSREFGMGLTTFKELFGAIYGLSPRAWISERRILFAHYLLLNSEMHIVDIAMEAGFSSQSYFTQSYRRRFGGTPSQARQEKEQLLTKTGCT